MITKSIDNIPIFTYLLEFETQKNSYLHHESLKTQKTSGFSYYKKLILSSFLYMASFTHLQIWYRMLRSINIFACGFIYSFEGMIQNLQYLRYAYAIPQRSNITGKLNCLSIISYKIVDLLFYIIKSLFVYFFIY